MARFKLGPGSVKELAGVHADLAAVVKRALELSVQEFVVHDGVRTLAEQKKLVASGASRTLDSRHLSGHAVDLVPIVNGKVRWEWDPIYVIADAVRAAARERDVPIRWGGAWDMQLTDRDEAPEDLVAGYVRRCRDEGRKAFIDGPHFELPKSLYP